MEYINLSDGHIGFWEINDHTLCCWGYRLSTEYKCLNALLYIQTVRCHILIVLKIHLLWLDS